MFNNKLSVEIAIDENKIKCLEVDDVIENLKLRK